jgi:hypothetical protein
VRGKFASEKRKAHKNHHNTEQSVDQNFFDDFKNHIHAEFKLQAGLEKSGDENRGPETFAQVLV